MGRWEAGTCRRRRFLPRCDGTAVRETQEHTKGCWEEGGHGELLNPAGTGGDGRVVVGRRVAVQPKLDGFLPVFFIGML